VFLFSQSLVSGLLVGGTFALVAVGLNLIFGVMEVVNFAHGAFMMMAMYLAFWLFRLLHLDPYISLIIIVIPTFFFIGRAVQKYLLNRIMDAPHINQLLLTLGLMIFLESFFELTHGPSPYSVNPWYKGITFRIGPAVASLPELAAFLGSVVFTVCLYFFLKKTKRGKMMRAVASHKMGARVCGINVENTYALAFGIGVALVGAAGCLIVPILYVTPGVGHVYLLTAFVVVVLGGLGSFQGALIGGLVLGLAESFTAVYFKSSMKVLVAFLIMLIVLMIRPSGLFGKESTLRDV
jgi:branched-chain amino acid transport system permease protein